jgi:hypothetical protein
VARQVLLGRGGALVQLLPMNEAVLAGALAVVAPPSVLDARARRLLRDRPLRLVSLETSGTAAALEALLGLAQELRSRPLRRRGEDHGPRPLGSSAAAEPRLERALFELRPLARELGLPDLPDGTRAALRSLLGKARGSAH